MKEDHQGGRRGERRKGSMEFSSLLSNNGRIFIQTCSNGSGLGLH